MRRHLNASLDSLKWLRERRERERERKEGKKVRQAKRECILRLSFIHLMLQTATLSIIISAKVQQTASNHFAQCSANSWPGASLHVALTRFLLLFLSSSLTLLGPNLVSKSS